MEDLSEFLWLYFSLLLPWPTAFVAYVAQMEIWSYLVVWLVIGTLVALALGRLNRRFYLMTWITVWFMPGTIICGSAALVPWPMAFYGSILGSECSTPMTVALSLLFNAIFVASGWVLLRCLAARNRAPK